MAEGLANAFHADEVEAVSAGSRPAGWVHPMAIRALNEIGIDIRDAKSKGASQFVNETFDIVVTVCDSAAQDCPHWPGAKRIEHWPIEDPSYGGYEDFVETRKDLAARIDELVRTMNDER